MDKTVNLFVANQINIRTHLSTNKTIFTYDTDIYHYKITVFESGRIRGKRTLKDNKKIIQDIGNKELYTIVSVYNLTFDQDDEIDVVSTEKKEITSI